MDSTKLLSKAEDLLAKHERTSQQIALLDSYISDLGQQMLLSSLDGNSQHSLNLTLRLSVAEGVNRMYYQYKVKLQQKLQQTSLPVSDVADDNVTRQQMTLVLPSGGGMDKTAGRWSSMQRHFYRHG